ncbi:MAG: hypothetical protein FVQ80_16070 [Planctomycetes bacterium]|nr:hypothetical protein [Planctomycetota bacterium]
MKKDPESLFKKSLKSVAASLAQWWSEMDSDAQEEAIDEIKEKIARFQNPILFSHPKAKDALELIFRKIELTKDVHWEMDSELRRFLEVLNLWEKQNLLSGQHAIGNRWISIFLDNPVFIMAVFSAVQGDSATAEFKQNVWNIIKQERKGVHGEHIAKNIGVPLSYVDALFAIFESEGKGWKSKEIGSSYFSPDPALC